MEWRDIDLTLGDFSGPLDMLCILVESREIKAEDVSLTDVLSQYVTFLVKTKRATIIELAEFFSLASRLLLGKIRSLIPGAERSDDDGADLRDDDDITAGEDEIDEEVLRAMLERFRPYRASAADLAVRLHERGRCFTREGEGGAPWFDIGDLYGLASRWWTMIEDYSRSRSAHTEEGFMEEIPDAVPEEVLVESRMNDIRAALAESGSATLSSLVERFGGVIVTLLALLELSRLGALDMVQSEPWGDVEVAAA